ncbi:MAG: hypothetical protein JWN32_3410 [Solirubrobacterales bacterium]|nr:hypothetical protein [Solirubrobacterales bacterium]
MLRGVALQLFPNRPPLLAVRPSLRELVAGGCLIQRELVETTRFSSAAGERGLWGPDRETLETPRSHWRAVTGCVLPSTLGLMADH